MIGDSWNKSAGIQHDLDPDYELIQAWMWVPNLYQIIEQSFKFLLTYKGKDIMRIHRLAEIFNDLDAEYQTSLTEVYMGYRELHDYLPQETLQLFLERADQGGGYEVWRYFLREGFPSQQSEIPSIHIGAMLEISLAVRHIICREIEPEWEWRTFRTIVPRIQESLFDEFESIAWKDHSQLDDSSGPSISEVAETDKVEFCHALLFRNLTWAYGFVGSAPCVELNKENTRIMELICGRMIRDHRHDFLQYIRRVASGTMKPFDISTRHSLNR